MMPDIVNASEWFCSLITHARRRTDQYNSLDDSRQGGRGGTHHIVLGACLSLSLSHLTIVINAEESRFNRLRSDLKCQGSC